MATHLPYLPLLSLVLLLLLPRYATPLSFDFNRFSNLQSANQCRTGMKVACRGGEASAGIPDGVVDLTTTLFSGGYSVGALYYSDPLHLWDNTTAELASFSTSFSFKIDTMNKTFMSYGDGIAFFLVPNTSQIPPPDSKGEALGLASWRNRFNASGDNSFVAVEIDTFPNGNWDGIRPHLGIDVNSISSVIYKNISSFRQQMIYWNATGNINITYIASTKNLTVTLTETANPSNPVSLWHVVDLKTVLPEYVTVGFSAATGAAFELNQILSWKFNSTSLLDPTETTTQQKTKQASKIWLWIVIAVGGLFIFGFALFLLWRVKRRTASLDEEYELPNDDPFIDQEFENERGPHRFSYKDLAVATENFSDARKLGTGGFGAVYRGFLSDQNIEVAIKSLSKDSKQGKKEYISEVKVINRLRHRNLVQLVGWCHGHGEFLLVYEFMPNSSLDKHLFNTTRLLPWTARYHIAVGLASSLLYLHEGSDQCVVHRDVKSSNVMLDAEFNAKLGDFGLARLVEHGDGMQTTALAGTMGYLAPECFLTGKGSVESDVYSFGIVALEIACGRRCIEHNMGEDKARLVDWVWRLYGSGEMLQAVDDKLAGDFHVDQMERLLIVALWCAHPDPQCRPQMAWVIRALKFETTIPDLPKVMPTYAMLSSMVVDFPSFEVSSSASRDTNSMANASSIASLSSDKTTIASSDKDTTSFLG